MPQQKLKRLRNRLYRLRRRRRVLRWVAGYSALALTALSLLGVAFVVDWALEMDRLQRAILLVLCAGVFVWSVRRYTVPWLGRRESLLDMALLVEKHEGIDSDLVAALQFDQPEAQRWGSSQLEQAVIDRAATLGNWMNVVRGLSPASIGRRLAMLAAVLLVCVAAGILAPEYVATFANRLLLGSRHYPTRTVIERILVNGHPVDLRSPRRTPIHAPYGQPVTFQAVCSGLLPPAGRAEIKALASGLETHVALDADAAGPGRYAGNVPRLVESVEYQLFLGDAWMDPARIVIAPLPVVDLQLEVIPPDYVSAGGKPQRMAKGLRQVSVVEGSRVLFHLTSDKPLAEAKIALSETDVRDFARAASASAGKTAPEETPPAERWTFTGLAPVTLPVRYAVQVADRDRLALEHPIQGVVRIKPDGRPMVTASALTPFVLATARPTIAYEVRDDYGLASVALLCRVERAGGTARPAPSAEPASAEVPVRETEIYRLEPGQRPQPEQRAEYRFDLTPLALQKGDRLEVVVKAVDYRGPRDGQAGLSEPLVFEVTDQQGILAMMMESDRKSVEQLKSMIRRQLGVGESE